MLREILVHGKINGQGKEDKGVCYWSVEGGGERGKKKQMRWSGLEIKVNMGGLGLCGRVGPGD